MSPELKNAHKNVNINFEYSPFHSDLYSLGVTFLNMLAIPEKNAKSVQVTQLASILNNEKYLHRKSSINLIKPLVDEDINKRMGYIEIKEKLGPINVNLE